LASAGASAAAFGAGLAAAAPKLKPDALASAGASDFVSKLKFDPCDEAATAALSWPLFGVFVENSASARFTRFSASASAIARRLGWFCVSTACLRLRAEDEEAEGGCRWLALMWWVTGVGEEAVFERARRRVFTVACESFSGSRCDSLFPLSSGCFTRAGDGRLKPEDGEISSIVAEEWFEEEEEEEAASFAFVVEWVRVATATTSLEISGWV
jgi:hypothetical protein